jgi:hypothetical protein
MTPELRLNKITSLMAFEDYLMQPFGYSITGANSSQFIKCMYNIFFLFSRPTLFGRWNSRCKLQSVKKEKQKGAIIAFRK